MTKLRLAAAQRDRISIHRFNDSEAAVKAGQNTYAVKFGDMLVIESVPSLGNGRV